MARKSEHPLLFKTPMIQAIIAGQKTQTRRIMRVQPPSDKYSLVLGSENKKKESGKYFWFNRNDPEQDTKPFSSPFGVVGDTLWIKETSAISDGKIIYRADNDGPFKWKSSLFMPRQHSRILLRSCAIRAERLTDISDADAMAEGCYPIIVGSHTYYKNHLPPPARGRSVSAKEAYTLLWESINGTGSFNLNPMVWVCEFEVKHV